MPFNGSELINNPWNITFSPFTDLFGQLLPGVPGAAAVFWLVPLSIIGVALYTKTREPSIVSMYLITSGLLLASGSIFVGAIDMALVFAAFATLGIVSLFVSLFYKR